MRRIGQIAAPLAVDVAIALGENDSRGDVRQLHVRVDRGEEEQRGGDGLAGLDVAGRVVPAARGRGGAEAGLLAPPPGGDGERGWARPLFLCPPSPFSGWRVPP